MKFCQSCGSRVTAPARGRAGRCPRCGASLAEGGGPSKAGLAASFPFETMRPSQKEVLDGVESALASSKRYIILEAPVGFGKSAIAAALCRHLGSAYLLTSTKQLQDQYSVDYGFPVVMGKSNFSCLVPTSSGRTVPCSRGRCEADWSLSDCPHFIAFEDYDDHMKGDCGRGAKCERLKDGRLCHYYRQKWDAYRSPVVVANYPFLLSELRYTDDVKRRRLLVCDEAHDLEKQMVGSAEFALKRSTVTSYLEGRREADGPLLPDLGADDPSAWVEKLLEVKGIYKSFVDAYGDVEGMQERVAACGNALESIGAFVDDLKATPQNWVVNSVARRESLDGGAAAEVEEVVFQPLEVQPYTPPLFEVADTTLLMSATVFSKERFCRALGIPEEEAVFVRVSGSTFPVENRRIFALGTAALSYSTMDAALEPIAQAVDRIMTRHAGERGVIHTTSYRQSRYIVEHVSEANRARLATTEGVASRSELLRAHGSTGESVLISPSLFEGVDLKDDLSRFQVLVKVPFPSLSERRIRVKLDRDKGWYDWQTALRLVQTYGRSVRSEDDYAVTYVLDSNFTRFLRQNADLFPGYFLEAVQSA